MVGALRRVARSEFAGQNLVLAALVILGLLLCWVVVVTPLDLVSQGLFALLTITAMLLIKGHPSRGVTLILVTLSIVISTRYIWWRLTETLQFASPFEAFLGIGLILAELYAWLVLVLGYIQTAWPLNRTPVGMPEDLALWPTVDLLIPTYNEPLSVVENTVFGALSVDYPPDKLRIYILDDGTARGIPRIRRGDRRRVHHPRQQHPRQGRQPQPRARADRRRTAGAVRQRPRAEPRVPAADGRLVPGRSAAGAVADAASFLFARPVRAEPAGRRLDPQRGTAVLRPDPGRQRSVERRVLLRLLRGDAAQRGRSRSAASPPRR